MYKEDDGRSSNPWVEMKVAEMARRRENNRRYRDNKRKRRQEMDSGMIEYVTRTGDELEVLVVVEVEGALWKRKEKLGYVGVKVEQLIEELIGEVNGLKEDGTELVKLINCGPWFRQTKKRTDWLIQVRLEPILIGWSKPKLKTLFEEGLRRFMKKPVPDPKDYLRGPG